MKERVPGHEAICFMNTVQPFILKYKTQFVFIELSAGYHEVFTDWIIPGQHRLPAIKPVESKTRLGVTSRVFLLSWKDCRLRSGNYKVELRLQSIARYLNGQEQALIIDVVRFVLRNAGKE